MNRPTKARSINSKLARLVVFAVGAATLVMLSIGLWQEATRYLSAKRESLLATGSAFAAASAGAVAARDANGASRAIRGIGRVGGVTYAAITDATGSQLAEVGSGARLAGDLELTQVDSGKNPFDLLFTHSATVTVPIVQAGVTVGTLHLVSQAADLPGHLLEVLLTAGLGGMIALGVGLTISFRLQHAITGPLIALTRTMSAVGANHDYATRVDVRSDDEVGVLAASFESMLEEVNERDARLRAHRDRLEADIAERTRELARATEVAVAANAAKSAFLATMSHEIRTPMHGMLVMAELLASSELPVRQRRYAEVIARSGQSLLAIINDILDFSKIEAGKLTLESIAFSPRDVVDTVVTLFAERAAEKALDLAACVAPTVPAQMMGDPVRVTQVLSNLVNNALKFAETGHVLITVGMEAAAVRFAVEDTGIGIAQDKAATIFDAFSQADQSTTRRFGGTGLGLSICRRLVDAMGGVIGVESREGHGSTFSFSMACAPGPEAPGLHRGEASRAVRVAIAGSASMRAALSSIAAAGLLAVGGTRPDGTAAGDTAAEDTAAEETSAGETSQKHDLIIDAAALVRVGHRGSAGRIVAVAAMGDARGAQALQRGLADVVIRRPIVQAEWDDVLARLRDGRPFETNAVAAGDLPASVQFTGVRVLVADDTPINREVACEALARLGIAADAVGDGRDALEALAARHYDLVLMDGSMPDIDGYQATRLLREEERRSGRGRQPVIALTAHVVGATADAWAEAGMDDVLHKPFTMAKLAACLERHLPGRSSEPQANPQPSDPLSQAGDAAQEAAEAPAQAAAEPGEPDLLDEDTQESLAEMAQAGASEGFIARIIAMFETDAPPTLAALTAALAAADAAAVATAAHRLKSMSLNVGAAGLARLLEPVEARARKQDLGPAAATLGELTATLRDSVAALHRRHPATGNDARRAAA